MKQKIIWMADWRRRDDREKTDKLIKTLVALYGAVAIGLLLCGTLYLLTAKDAVGAEKSPSNAVVEQGRLPESPDKTYKVVKSEITAYNPEVGQCDDTPFLTASQQPVREGIVACPRHLKFGTWVEIQGKMYQCQDRMNIRYTNNFDIFVFSKSKALAFGRKVLEVKIYE